MIKGAIFDFDGTIFDSMHVWNNAAENYLRALGIEPKHGLNRALKSTSLYQAACYCKSEYDLQLSTEEIMTGINKTIEDQYFHTVLPKPDAEDFLSRLQQLGVKMCIATATDRYMIEAALKRCGMSGFFSEVFTCTETGCGKDEPLIFREALKHLGTTRADTVVFDDAYYALLTARSDGFPTVGVFDKFENRQAEIRALSDCYLKDYSNTEDFWKFASEH